MTPDKTNAQAPDPQTLIDAFAVAMQEWVKSLQGDGTATAATNLVWAAQKLERAKASLLAEFTRLAAPKSVDAYQVVKSWQGPLWDAINAYMHACGGNWKKGGEGRIKAVSAFNRTLENLVDKLRPAPSPQGASQEDLDWMDNIAAVHGEPTRASWARIKASIKPAPTPSETLTAPADRKELRERVAAEIFWHFPKDDYLDWKTAKGCDKVKHRECADKILTIVAPVASKWPSATDPGYREATGAGVQL